MIILVNVIPKGIALGSPVLRGFFMAEKIYQLEEQTIRDLLSIQRIETNTSKPMKGLAAWIFLHTLIRGYNAKDVLSEVGERCVQSQHASKYIEPVLSSALESSEHKAGWLRLQDHRVHSSGMDSVVYVWGNNRSGKQGWIALHKLERNHPNGLTAEEIAREYVSLRDKLVYPKSGKLNLAWHESVSYINGRQHSFDELLLVETKPLDLQLFSQQFDLALISGNILNRAPRIDLIETVFKNDPYTMIGLFTANQISEYGSNSWNRLQPADVAMQKLAVASVLTTVPHAIFAEGNNMDIFDKAYELSSQVGEVWS